MGAKSYVAGLRGEAVNSVANAAMQGLSASQRLKNAKDSADINREKLSIEGKANEFLTGLEQDRNWQKYPEKLDEAFSDITAGIDDNELLSSAAKRRLKEDILPLYKEQARQGVTSLQSKSQFAEIKVEVDGYGSVLTNNTGLSVEEASAKYREHLTELGLWNEFTVGKKVEEYEYGMIPSKAVQSLLKTYGETYTEGNVSYQNNLNAVAQEYGLDPTQKASFVKLANAQKKIFDDNLADQYDRAIDNLRTEVGQALDAGQIFPVDSIDSLIQDAPPAYRSILFSEKGKIDTNNDNILVNYIKEQIYSKSYTGPGTDINDALSAIKDPDKRSEMRAKVLANAASGPVRNADAMPQSYSKKLESVDSSEIPATEREKAKAKAFITLEQLGDVPSYDDVRKLVSEYYGSRMTEAISGLEDPTNKSTLSKSQTKVLGSLISDWEKDNPGKTPTASDLTNDGVNFITDDTVKQALELRGTEQTLVSDQMSSGMDNSGQLGEEVVIPEGDVVSPGMGQEVDTSNMDEVDLASYLIYNAVHGKPVTDSDISRVMNPELSRIISDIIIGGKTINNIDDTLTLSYVNDIRINPNIREEYYNRILQEGVAAGLITEDTAKKMSRPFYVNNPNFATVDTIINSSYTKNKDFIADELEFKEDLLAAIDRSIMMNPNLIGDDFDKLRGQINLHVNNALTGGILRKLEKSIKAVSGEGIAEIEAFKSMDLSSLDSKDFHAFLSKVGNAEYDMFLRKDMIMNPSPDRNMKLFRNDSKDDLIEKVSKSITGMSFSDLDENGSVIDKMEVLVTAEFLASGATLEKALYGSFGIKPNDMIVINNQWAFADPQTEGLYFIPQFTDSETDEGLFWTMVQYENGRIGKTARVNDYIDPTLKYEYRELKAEIKDPLFKKREDQIKEYTESSTVVQNYRKLESNTNMSDENSSDPRNKYSKYYKESLKDPVEQLPEIEPFKAKRDRLKELEKEMGEATYEVLKNRLTIIGDTRLLRSLR